MVRIAINRAIQALLSGPGAGPEGASRQQGSQAALAQAALTAVLRASPLDRSAADPAALQLGGCSVQQAQRVLRAMLRRMEQGEALAAAWEERYGSSLAALLAQQEDCARLVRLGKGAQQALALLRVDLVLGEACTLRGGLPRAATPSTPSASEAGSAGRGRETEDLQELQGISWGLVGEPELAAAGGWEEGEGGEEARPEQEGAVAGEAAAAEAAGEAAGAAPLGPARRLGRRNSRLPPYKVGAVA
jgi:hypothetical protein